MNMHTSQCRAGGSKLRETNKESGVGCPSKPTGQFWLVDGAGGTSSVSVYIMIVPRLSEEPVWRGGFPGLKAFNLGSE